MVLWPSRNCPMTGGTAGAVKPASPKGRSEAEWLDRAEDRRTISRRDGRTRATAMFSGERTRRTGRAGLEKDRQVNGAMAPQAEIQCECAFTYMNAVFRKNLTDAFSVDATAVDTAFDTERRTRRWHDRARFCRTTKTRIWRRERPRKPGAGP